jgi:hypothetical protein
MSQLQRTPQEALRPLLPWTIEHVCRFALLDDAPVVHEDHPVADLTREVQSRA